MIFFFFFRGQSMKTKFRVWYPLYLRVCLLKDSKSNKLKKGGKFTKGKKSCSQRERNQYVKHHVNTNVYLKEKVKVSSSINMYLDQFSFLLNLFEFFCTSNCSFTHFRGGKVSVTNKMHQTLSDKDTTKKMLRQRIILRQQRLCD